MRSLVIDHGAYPELALRLAREWNDEVFYHSPWVANFPNPLDQLIGSGLEDFGVTRVDFPFTVKPDLYVFPDILFADLQEMLRNDGAAVWGAGWGELLETDRWKFYEKLAADGWPVPDFDDTIGIEALTNRLKGERDERFIKVAQYYRGLTETYQHRGWPASRTQLEEWRAKLGPRGDNMRFMVQEPIEDSVEPGIDMIIANGKILLPALLGYEAKDQALISKVVTEIPEMLLGPIVSIAEELGSGYSNFFSAELRVTPEGEAYFNDATCRLPHPGDAVWMELCSNLGAIIDGSEDAPEFTGQYAVQINLDSKEADKRPLHISFPEEIRDNVKLYQGYRDENGEYWSLPRGVTNVVSVVVCGDDLEKVKAEAMAYAREIKADGLGFEESCLDLIEKDIKTGRENGVEF